MKEQVNNEIDIKESELTAEQALKLLFPDASLLAQLERMKLSAGNRIKGTLAGKRRSVSLGGSQEFADYRAYAPGDDIRRLDWNVYGRTGRAYIRQYWDEQELHITLFVDGSRSMNFGGTSANKLKYALRLAACIGYTALCGEDRVAVKLFSGKVESELLSIHGRAASSKLFRFLAKAIHKADAEEDIPSIPQSSMAAPFQAAGALPRRTGVSWIFTDALFEQGVEDAIRSLTAARQQIVFVHLLSPEELRPELAGELKLIDSELRTGKEVAVGYKLLEEYKSAVIQYQNELKRICADYGAAYIFADTGVPLEETVRRSLLSNPALHT